MRVGEESADQAGQPLEAAQREDGLRLEVVFAGDSRPGDAVVLDVLPHPFVGVELNCRNSSGAATAQIDG